MIAYLPEWYSVIMASKENENTEKKPKTCSRDNHGSLCRSIREDRRWFGDLGGVTRDQVQGSACHVYYIIPASSHDFVASALLAVGAYALLVNGMLTVMKSYRHTCIVH